jgi:predicted HTH transcriptional regulator
MFIAKHLPDPFYLEGAQRISLRDNIFREVIANMIIHKEYLRPEPSRFIIERGRILVENSNRPHINGIITLDNSIPFPKNPNIAKAFRLLGRAEELGSGIRNIYKFCKYYCGSDPKIVDDNALFKFILPVNFFEKVSAEKNSAPQDTQHDAQHDTQQDTLQDTPQDDRQSLILSFCKTPKTREEIQAYIKVSDRSYFSIYVLNPLISEKKLLRTMPEKPRSKNQKYITASYNKSVQDTQHDAQHDPQHDTLQDTPQDDRQSLILSFCKTPKSRQEIQAFIGIKDKVYLREYILLPLIKAGKLVLTIAKKPRSKYQKYVVKGYKNDTNE